MTTPNLPSPDFIGLPVLMCRMEADSAQRARAYRFYQERAHGPALGGFNVWTSGSRVPQSHIEALACFQGWVTEELDATTLVDCVQAAPAAADEFRVALMAAANGPHQYVTLQRPGAADLATTEGFVGWLTDTRRAALPVRVPQLLVRYQSKSRARLEGTFITDRLTLEQAILVGYLNLGMGERPVPLLREEFTVLSCQPADIEAMRAKALKGTVSGVNPLDFVPMLQPAF